MQVAVTPPRIRALLTRFVERALHAVDPAQAVAEWVTRRGARVTVGQQCYHLHHQDRIVVVGAGKASARMALALEDILGPRLSHGLVTVKYGHATPTRRIQILEAAHPVPDEAGAHACQAVLALLGQLTARDLVFVLLSGGASSLWPAPAPGITLADKQRTTHLLLRSGATIQEINVVRKHLSAMKGGRLPAATPARIVTLILSDVIGDDLTAIGSGPTAPDPSTFQDAIAILGRYHLRTRVPPSVRRHMREGQRGARDETPKPGAAIFRRVHNVIIANNTAAVEAVAKEARRAGLKPLILTTSLIGDAREAAKWFGAMAQELAARERPLPRPACLIAGGELTVTVRGQGRGGRAQEFALAAAEPIRGLRRTWIAAMGTDGTDGPTDAAGAVVDGETLARAGRQGLEAGECLHDNDSYRFFKTAGGHITTGPTGTNVNDLYLLLAL